MLSNIAGSAQPSVVVMSSCVHLQPWGSCLELCKREGSEMLREMSLVGAQVRGHERWAHAWKKTNGLRCFALWDAHSSQCCNVSRGWGSPSLDGCLQQS